MVSLVNVQNSKGKAISRGKAPREASMLQVKLDFTVDLTLQVSYDMSDTIQNKWGISGIQSVFMDNSLNSDVLTLLFDNGLNLVCPAYAQCILPVFFSGEVLSFRAFSTVAVVSTLTFLNTREQAQLWTAKIPVAGTVNVSGSTILAQKTNDTFDAFSQPIAAGGTAQLLMSANASRKGLFIRNPGTPLSQNIAATEPLYIGFGAAFAAMTPGMMGSWELFPGEQLPQFDPVPTEAVYVVAATTNHLITAYAMS